MWSYPRPSGEGACNVDRASQPNDAMNIIGPTAYEVILTYIIVVKNTCYLMKHSTLYTARTFLRCMIILCHLGTAEEDSKGVNTTALGQDRPSDKGVPIPGTDPEGPVSWIIHHPPPYNV